MEHKKNPESISREQAEKVFAELVANTIRNNPAGVRPLKYEPGSFVYIDEARDTFKVEKGNAGVYLVISKDGRFAISLENKMSLTN